MNEEHWTCPACTAPNVDIRKQTAMPMCGDCGEIYSWIEIAPRIVVHLLETERWGGGGYRPCFTREGETGYYPAKDWDWGTDKEIAQEICDERNKIAGFTEIEAYLVVMKSMGYGGRQ